MLRYFAYFVNRLVQMVPIALLIILANFFLLKLAPGDMADVMAGEMGAATPELMASLRQQFGADQPLPQQLLHYYEKLLSFDLGYSFRNGASVATLIAERLPATVLLAGSGLLLACLAGVGLGWLSANTRRAWLRHAISTFTTVGFATPLFWTGLMLIVLFSIHFRWLPTGGLEDIDAEYQGYARLADIARHMIMPVLSLAFFYLAIYTRITRNAIKEVQGMDHVRTARAKGLGELRISIVHVLRNALLPVVTVTGMQVGSILSGSVVVETVFAWPGLGRLAFDAVMQRDLNLLLGILFCSSLVVMIANIATDLAYARLDARIALK
ncbi:ABC transporter permease [Achromobacter aloeverae]|uniref:ABC transporter permease n=1 Tax=Achromobacter aloeverae TaxID=1750518 RepID=A0A4Q1HNZ6_9BURK|nr:ABC transporter permease [Achromobacter aloeverae]RXN91244.1 ABC transporter permease [Achromobacter aloeverae]